MFLVRVVLILDVTKFEFDLRRRNDILINEARAHCLAEEILLVALGWTFPAYVDCIHIRILFLFGRRNSRIFVSCHIHDRVLLLNATFTNRSVFVLFFNMANDVLSITLHHISAVNKSWYNKLRPWLS